MRRPRTPHPPQIRQEGPACPCPRGGRRLPDVGQPDDADLEGRPEPADDGVRLHPVACLLRRHLGRQSRAQQSTADQIRAEHSRAERREGPAEPPRGGEPPGGRPRSPACSRGQGRRGGAGAAPRRPGSPRGTAAAGSGAAGSGAA